MTKGTVTKEMLDAATNTLKANAARPKVVGTEAEAEKLTRQDPTGHIWHVGDQYYLCKTINQDIPIDPTSIVYVDNQEPTEAASGLNDGLGRCGTCKHWTRYSDKYNKDRGLHAGSCSCEKFTEDTGDLVLVDGLQYWDYEGYSAGFYTGENFGCVHHATA